MSDEIYRKTLELCRDEDWSACETSLACAHQALRVWEANQMRYAKLKKKGKRKLREALILKVKYPGQLKLRELCEEAAKMAEAGDWGSALEPLELVTKLGNRLEWDEVLGQALRRAKSSSW
jgi:hypothetical protein